MPAPELRFENRTVYFRKAIKTPNITSESVLTKDPFQFTELWLKRNCKDALPFWKQAENYYNASRVLPSISSPLTSYYCFLNAAKALLTVKGVKFSELHGVSGEFDPLAKRVLSNETVKIHSSGILAALSDYLDEPETNNEHSLTDLLVSLPFIHRAYRHTFKSQLELFIPIKNVVYRKHPTDNYVWFTAEIFGRFNDKRSLKTIPAIFELDAGYSEKCIIRTKKRVKWFNRGASDENQQRALTRLHNLHKKVRLNLGFISAPVDLWYLRRNIAGKPAIRRYGMTIIMSIMHRLSELSRYDPDGLSAHLEGRANWLLTEFIQLSPAQFIDELVCEMTSMELRMPGVRP